MLNLEELSQLVAFADKKTLSKVAEEFHISTPSITRAMKNIEDEFGVPLFIRSKNRIELNDNGKMAVEYAGKLLQDARQMISQVRMYDERKKTIVVKSCAPAPMWELMKKLGMTCPGRMVSSAICQNEEVIQYIDKNECDIAILPYELTIDGWKTTEFMQERLYVCVPESHELAKYSELSGRELNGFNFLLKSELGFWDTLCHRMMPASKFLVQTDETAFDEIVNSSSLPCFTTDYFKNSDNIYPGRVNIPITDKEANVTFYVMSK